MDVKIVKDSAFTVYVSHPTASYGIFCFNSYGDLFLNSDWGFYGYAWRAFGEKGFKDFLKGLNAEYVIGKFEINYSSTFGKRIPKARKENVEILINCFIDALNKE